MRFGCFATLLTVLSFTLTGQGHDRIGAKQRHWKRISKEGLAANSTNLGPRGQLEKRFDNARFSFYDAGLSACGGTYSDSDYIVALNAPQYAGGALCFQTITITANGKTTTAKIVDRCEGCPYAGLDFSRGLFDYFASEGDGIIYGTWTLGENTPSTSQTPKWTPTPTPTVSSTVMSTAWSTTVGWGNTTSTAPASSSSATVSSTAASSTMTNSAGAVETASGLIGEMYALYVQLGSLVVVA